MSSGFFGLTKKRQRKVKRFLLFFFLMICLGALIYLLLFSGFFRVEKINVEGGSEQHNEDVYSLIQSDLNEKKYYFFSNNILLINGESVREEVLESFPGLEDIKISKKYPDILNVNISERERAAKTCFQDKCFFIDKNGVIFELFLGKDFDLPLIEDNREKGRLSLGREVISPTLLAKILLFNERLKDLNLQSKKIVIVSSERVNLEMEEGWEIYLNPAGDTDWQFTKLEVVIKNYLSAEERGKLDYIELRFGNTAPVKKK